VDWICGAVLLLKSVVAKKAGLLDPWYFFGYVDLDYSLRVRKHGFRIVYVPTAKVWHKVGASAKKAHITYADPSSYYYLIRHSFSLYIYIYHLLLLPVLIFRWGVLFIVKNRDVKALCRFFSDFNRFLFKKRGRGL
jgi:GT2 family glycosyltransferase